MNSNYKILVIVAVFVLNISTAFSQGAAINTTGAAPDASAGLDVQFNNKGFLVPRMTTTERNSIASPAQGLQVFNTTTNCLEIYISPLWQNILCGCNPPPAPTAGTHVAAQAQITWNWNAAAGAAGYKYNTTNDYATATDNYTSTSYTQTGLTCNAPYTLYVWSYSTCGHSSELTLFQNTATCFTCGTSTVTFTYRGSNVTYGTAYNSATGECWLDRNLGATAVATAYNHFASYGDLFQWGRLDDGHQDRNSSTTTTLSNTDNPGHSNFIKSSSTYFDDWRSPQNNSLWQGGSGINNPCPSGWRLPTQAELYAERMSWSTYNRAGAIASPLKLPAAGYHNDNGSVYLEGDYGLYWSSTVSGTYAYNLIFDGSSANMNDASRHLGRSVRCIKE